MVTGIDGSDNELSARELDVLRALERGLSNKEIAAELYIGVETVKSHLSLIYRKLDVTRRGQAVAWLNAHPELSVDPKVPLATASVRTQDGTALITLVGEFDITTMSLLGDALQEARRSAPAMIDLEMGSVVFMDSSALRALVGLRSDASGATVRIVSASPQVRRILEFANLLTIFGME